MILVIPGLRVHRTDLQVPGTKRRPSIKLQARQLVRAVNNRVSTCILAFFAMADLGVVGRDGPVNVNENSRLVTLECSD